MGRIIVVSELFYPNLTSTAYIMTEIVKELAQDNNVTVICSEVSYDSNLGETHQPFLEQIELITVPTGSTNKNQFWSRLFGGITTATKLARRVSKIANKDDTVFAVTNPFLLILTLAFTRLFKRFNFVLLVHDVFPENTIPAGLLKPKTIIYRLLKTCFDWAYSKPDRLIVLGRDMRELLSAKTNNRSKIHIVENWYDGDLKLIEDLDRDEYYKNNLAEKIIIGFGGNIGRLQNLPAFIRLFGKTSNPRLVMSIIGHGADEMEMKEAINHSGKKDVFYFLGPKSRTDQSLFLSTFDIGLITLAPGMYGLGTPSKTYNLLALGKPILFIGDKGSEVDLLIQEYNIGWSFSWDETSLCIDFLEKLSEVDQEKSINAQRVAKEKFSQEVILKKIINVIKHVN